MLRDVAVSCDPDPRDVLDALRIMNQLQGVGISAPQIGAPGRWFIAHELVIDPIILWESELQVTQPEGCLSLPGVSVEVPRAYAIRVLYKNRFCTVITKLEGMEARVFQHEMDHLNGILITDYATGRVA